MAEVDTFISPGIAIARDLALLKPNDKNSHRKQGFGLRNRKVLAIFNSNLDRHTALQTLVSKLLRFRGQSPCRCADILQLRCTKLLSLLAHLLERDIDI